jgi:hypothetical protein
LELADVFLRESMPLKFCEKEGVPEEKRTRKIMKLKNEPELFDLINLVITFIKNNDQ